MLPFQPIAATVTVAPNKTGISQRSRRGFTSIGRITAASPRTSATLVMFEPNTLPTARSPEPSIPATRLTTNSGADVPRATTVAPTITGESPKPIARREAVHTRSNAPVSRTPRPATVRAAFASTVAPWRAATVPETRWQGADQGPSLASGGTAVDRRWQGAETRNAWQGDSAGRPRNLAQSPPAPAFPDAAGSLKSSRTGPQDFQRPPRRRSRARTRADAGGYRPPPPRSRACSRSRYGSGPRRRPRPGAGTRGPLRARRAPGRGSPG